MSVGTQACKRRILRSQAEAPTDKSHNGSSSPAFRKRTFTEISHPHTDIFATFATYFEQT